MSTLQESSGRQTSHECAKQRSSCRVEVPRTQGPQDKMSLWHRRSNSRRERGSSLSKMHRRYRLYSTEKEHSLVKSIVQDMDNVLQQDNQNNSNVDDLSHDDEAKVIADCEQNILVAETRRSMAGRNY